MGPGETETAAPPRSAVSVAIEQRREENDAWHARRDDNISAGLRGRS